VNPRYTLFFSYRKPDGSATQYFQHREIYAALSEAETAKDRLVAYGFAETCFKIASWKIEKTVTLLEGVEK
jgi:hypothetical protein